MQFKKVYTFDDVALVPQFNNVSSRLEPDLSTWLTRKVKLGIPLLAANMDTVIDRFFAEKVLVPNNSIPIFHRFTSKEEIESWARAFEGNVILSCGVPKDGDPTKHPGFCDIMELIIDKKINITGVCLDIAQGHGQSMLRMIDGIKGIFKEDLQIIAGNVCTPMGYADLVNSGADAVKVGVGPGAACTTRITTGFGVSQFSAIYEIGQMAKKLRVPIIADGGIRNSRDVVLALAAGATTVMIGKLFALTQESAAEKKNIDGKVYAKYRGQASIDFQEDYYGALKTGTVPEGESFWAECLKNGQDVIDELLGGLRSGLTYGGARTIAELQRKAEFVETSGSYLQESNVRR